MRREQPLGSRHVFTYYRNEERLKRPEAKRKGPRPLGKSIGSVKSAFNAALKRADIQDFTFHDLRHTFASQMIMKGAGLKDVQEILGHKNVTMTMRYAHLSQEHKRKAVNLLKGLTASDEPARDVSQTCHIR